MRNSRRLISVWEFKIEPIEVNHIHRCMHGHLNINTGVGAIATDIWIETTQTGHMHMANGLSLGKTSKGCMNLNECHDVSKV